MIKFQMSFIPIMTWFKIKADSEVWAYAHVYTIHGLRKRQLPKGAEISEKKQEQTGKRWCL